MTPAELAARLKVEPTSKAMGPLYDKIEHAIHLIDCAYFATRGNDTMRLEEVGDALRASLDDGVKLLGEVKETIHDMTAWA